MHHSHSQMNVWYAQTDLTQIMQLVRYRVLPVMLVNILEVHRLLVPNVPSESTVLAVQQNAQAVLLVLCLLLRALPLVSHAQLVTLHRLHLSPIVLRVLLARIKTRLGRTAVPSVKQVDILTVMAALYVPIALLEGQVVLEQNLAPRLRNRTTFRIPNMVMFHLAQDIQLV